MKYDIPAGWELVRKGREETVGKSRLDLLSAEVNQWCQENKISTGTHIRITVEEV
jgi:hypothetical protein